MVWVGRIGVCKVPKKAVVWGSLNSEAVSCEAFGARGCLRERVSLGCSERLP